MADYYQRKAEQLNGRPVPEKAQAAKRRALARRQVVRRPACGMMGDGVIDIPYIRRLVENTGYSGFCEVEILSKDWWKRPIGEVLNTCVVRYRTVC
jgi:sugar phosphate isomerase/epimerase